ncbi:MAG: hypothetical protein J0J14_04375 [Hyphomicrobium sp.]|nr:hypothetical protein [Hyphomicrobium sp.]MBN9266006.1 hypothetical protein [Hyphomicrobium sp.]
MNKSRFEWVSMPMREQTRGVTMASSKLIAGRSRLAAAAIGSGFAMVLGAWLWGFASPDQLLERSYARVTPQGTIFLDDAGSTTPPLPVTQVALPVTPPNQQPALVVDGEPVPTGVLSEPLVAGERVEFRGADAKTRTVEVQSVAEMGAPVAGMPGVRLQLVTARTLDKPRPQMLRLIFAVREAPPAKPVPVATPVADKVL